MANTLPLLPEWLQDGLRFEGESLVPGREDSLYGYINTFLSLFFPIAQRFMIIPPNGRAEYDIPPVSQKPDQLLLGSYRPGIRLHESRDEKSRRPSSLSSNPMRIAL
jgi:hypothetical protein